MMEIGEKINRLKLIEYTSNGKGIFLCECGTVKEISRYNVERGAVKSCGCLFKEHPNNTKHSGSGTRLYIIWKGIRQRCNNPNCKIFKNYGGRGIKLCDEWNDFNNFKEWAMINGYKDNLSIDRIDVNGNYTPDNCRWVTNKIQANNKRNNRLLTLNGTTKTMSEWSEETGIKVSTIWERLNKGWSVERALSQKVVEI